MDLFSATTGIKISKEDLIMQSAKVYNFQRVFNIRMGKGLRLHDAAPYRSLGPVTKEEYESRAERYDQQIITEMGLDPAGKTTEEKMALHREWRTDRFSKLMDSVYTRRGWTLDGVPTLARLQGTGPRRLPGSGGSGQAAPLRESAANAADSLDEQQRRKAPMLLVNEEPLDWHAGMTVRDVLKAQELPLPHAGHPRERRADPEEGLRHHASSPTARW